MSFRARMEALPPAQRALWPELTAVPKRYVLYGGTGLALRLAHRASVDFDFFAHDPLDHRELDSMAFVRAGETLQEGPNERTVLSRHEGGSVKVSFFGGIRFGRVGEPEPTADGVLRAASLLDLAGTKIKALLQHAFASDYRDIVALLDHGVELGEILGSARALFGPAFNPIVARKTLGFFEGGDLATLADAARDRLVTELERDTQASVLALRSTRLD